MPEHTIAENLTRLQNAKTAIGNAIAAKGGTVAAGDGLEEFAADIASITNQYTSSDEGKVVSSGQLVAQTSTTATANGTLDTTTNNEVVVDVPNTYTAGDEGKVVSGGALVAQTAYPTTITENGTYNTTENNSVTVNVPSLPTGIEMAKLTPANDSISNDDMYIINASNRTYIVGQFERINTNPMPQFSYPSTFIPNCTKLPISGTYYIYNTTITAYINSDAGKTISIDSANNLVTIQGYAGSYIYNYAIMLTTN
jgi:hypothetical protein